jgi:hypothetical protein
MTVTPAKGLTQPVEGGDNNTWGSLLNTDLSLIDSALGATGFSDSIEIVGTWDLSPGERPNSGGERDSLR